MKFIVFSLFFGVSKVLLSSPEEVAIEREDLGIKTLPAEENQVQGDLSESEELAGGMGGGGGGFRRGGPMGGGGSMGGRSWWPSLPKWGSRWSQPRDIPLPPDGYDEDLDQRKQKLGRLLGPSPDDPPPPAAPPGKKGGFINWLYSIWSKEKNADLPSAPAVE